MTELELRRAVTSLAEHYANAGTIYEWSAGLDKMIRTYNDHLPLARNYKYVKEGGWCMLFVSDLFIETGLADIMQTEVGPWEAMQADKAAGRFREPKTYTPQPGDLIYYYFTDTDASGKKIGWYHVGLVTNADKNIIFTTEGNVQDRVVMMAKHPDDKAIAGFCCPDYASKIRTEIDGLPVPPIPDETGIYFMTANNNGVTKTLSWMKK